MSDTMESTKSGDDSSVVIVTPAETEPEVKEEKTEETKTESTEGKPEHSTHQTRSLVNTSKDKSEEKKDEDKKDGDEEKKEEEEKEKVIVGLLADTKDLYAKYDEHGDRSWTDKYPTDLEEAAENEETQKYAVIIRKSKSTSANISLNLLTPTKRSPRRLTPTSPSSSTVSSFSPPT